MKENRDIIYKDLTNEGVAYTVYENGRCMGTFLDDDVELDIYRNRISQRGECDFRDI